MEAENFEDKLLNMTKPQVGDLKHEDMIANAVISAKDRSVLSWWWLSMPLYIIAAFCMKSFFMPGITLVSSIRDFSSKEKYMALFLFVILPIVFIGINAISIYKVYKTSGRAKLLQSVWFNLLMVLFSIIILLIYSL